MHTKNTIDRYTLRLYTYSKKCGNATLFENIKSKVGLSLFFMLSKMLLTQQTKCAILTTYKTTSQQLLTRSLKLTRIVHSASDDWTETEFTLRTPQRSSKEGECKNSVFTYTMHRLKGGYFCGVGGDKGANPFDSVDENRIGARPNLISDNKIKRHRALERNVLSDHMQQPRLHRGVC